MDGLLNASHWPAEVNLACLVVQVVHRRMRLIVGAEHFFRFQRLIRFPAVGDGHRRQDHAFLVTQSNVFTDLQPISEIC